MKRSGFIKRKAPKKRVMPPRTVGRSLVSKKPLRDAEHLARVRTLYCHICGGTPCHAHHIRECLPRTMGVRVGDDMVIPLCPPCHTHLHDNGGTVWDYPESIVKKAAALYAETLKLRSPEGRAALEQLEPT